MSDPTEADVNAVIAEFGGDMRAAIRALLHDLTLLALDRELAVSRGLVRGRSLAAAVVEPDKLDGGRSAIPGR